MIDILHNYVYTYVYTMWRCNMSYVKVFKSGNSQAIRLPKEFRLDVKEVGIKKVGDIILLVPKKNVWSSFVKSMELFTSDYMCDSRAQGKLEKRVLL